MGYYPGIEISASGLFAQRIKLNTVANNIANVKTTRTPEGGPYRRQDVIFETQDRFKQFLERLKFQIPLYTTHPAHIEKVDPQKAGTMGGGVKASVVKDEYTPFKRIYDPSHPDADSEGYVKLPNVDITKEMVDMVIAKRAYEANVTVISASKSMARTALGIGR